MAAERRSCKRPIGSKQFQPTWSVDELPSNDSPFQSFQEALNASPLTASSAAELLRNHLTTLGRIRTQCDQNFHSFEASCGGSPSPTPLPHSRRVSFETDIRPSVSLLQAKPAEPRGVSGHTSKPHAAVKPHLRSSTDPPFEPSKSMNSSTIWNNVSRFFTVTPTLEMFRPYLAAAQVPDTSVPLGTHYSIGVNQKLKQKFRNVQLRLPPALVETPEQTEISPTVVFHRLLSAFVPCDDKPFKPRAPSHPPTAFSFSDFSPAQHPVSYAGTSTYSLVPFEQKLMLEIKAIGLMPDRSAPRLTDNEVMNEIIEKNKELGELVEVSNGLRRQIFAELEKKENWLLERAEMAKQWANIAPRTEVAPKKDQKRPKTRDKLV